MNCPECERYRVLLKVISDPERRKELERQQADHQRAAHPAGLAAGLWPGKHVQVRQ